MQIAILHHPTTTLEIVTVPDDIDNIEDFLEETYGLVDINYMATDEIPVKFMTAVKSDDGYILQEAVPCATETPAKEDAPAVVLGFQIAPKSASDTDAMDALVNEFGIFDHMVFRTRDDAEAFMKMNWVSNEYIIVRILKGQIENPVFIDETGTPTHMAVRWPWSQNLFDVPGFREHSELINYEGSYEDYGSSAYKVETAWLHGLPDDILSKVECEAYVTPDDETGNCRIED